MKDNQQFWEQNTVRVDDETEAQAIMLLDADGSDSNVLSIHMEGQTVVFTEQCDSWNYTELSKPQAIAALKQAIEWIEKQP
jgi:hypothetical protein